MALARMLLRAGKINREEERLPLGDMVTSSLGRWIESVWGGRREWVQLGFCLEPGVGHLTGDVPSDLSHDDIGAFREQFGIDAETDHLGISMFGDDKRLALIGDAVERLEQSVPRLGVAVTYWIHALGLHFGVKTPNHLVYWVEWLHWAGASSEDEYIEENGLRDGDYGGVRKQELDDEFPRRLATPRGTRHDGANEALLRRVAMDGPSKEARAARLVLEAREIGWGDGFWTTTIRERNDWYEDACTPVVVGWRSATLVSRIADDYFNGIYNGEDATTPCQAIFALPLGDPGAFDAMASRWKEHARRLEVLDELIGVVAANDSMGEERADGHCA